MGSHLCAALAECGWEVVALDDFSGGGRPAESGKIVRGVDTVRVDITEPGLDRLIAEIGPQVVFHLAAVSSVPLCREDPRRCMRVNVEGTARVLDAACRGGAAKLVNVSSLAVYGLSEGESDPSYGLSKRLAEDLVRRRASAAGIGWTTLRPANVYGPRQQGDGESAVVATWLKAMAAAQPLFLDGDGRQTRDFLYVTDAVEAMILAVDRADGLSLELGTGRETSLRGLLDAMREVTGWQGEVRRRPARPGDIRHSVTDPQPARAALGWTGRTDLITGLRKTWEWVTSR